MLFYTKEGLSFDFEITVHEIQIALSMYVVYLSHLERIKQQDIILVMKLVPLTCMIDVSLKVIFFMHETFKAVKIQKITK